MEETGSIKRLLVIIVLMLFRCRYNDKNPDGLLNLACLEHVTLFVPGVIDLWSFRACL